MNGDDMMRTVAERLGEICDELSQLRCSIDRLSRQLSRSQSTWPEGGGQVPAEYRLAHHWVPAAFVARQLHHQMADPPPLAVWIYTRGNWHLDPKSVPEGYVAAAAPNIEGTFEGQCVKTECRPC